MKKTVNTIWIALIVWTLVGQTVNAAESDVLNRIQKRYQEIASFKGSFTQRNFSSRSEQPRSAAGLVSYIRPGKMRWDYQKPDEQLLVTDGITLWLFDPLLENVTVQALKKVTPGTPLEFLLGAGNLEDDFIYRPVTRNLIDNPEVLVVELEPKNSIAALEFIQLAVDPETYDFLQIVLVDTQGNHRVIEFKEMEYNLTLDEDQFRFEISPDMEVIYADQ
ncbi:MAG: outer membrane lipoprotein chaperone LolA [SAR324 cluster bacterium]|nr:outer membrane lipoprotein chaperone LolA [SAR324 cluster bacterium]